MTNNTPERNDASADKTTVEQALIPLVTDLFYPSESDEPIEPVSCYLKQETPLTVSQIKDWQMLPPAVYVEERPAADFWAPVVMEQDWYTDDEKARTARFQQLHQFLERELTVCQVFYVGEMEMDVYLLGREPSGQRTGIHTKVVQT